MKKEEKTKQTCEKIVHAATIEFGSRSYDAVSLNAICGKYQIAKGLIYHNFKNKDELYLYCVKKSFEKLMSYMEEGKEEAKTAREEIRIFLERREVFFAENPYDRNIFFNVMLYPAEHLKEALFGVMERYDAYIREQYRHLLSKIRLREGISMEMAVEYLSLFQNGDRPYTAVEIISQLAWGLGYCGMPHILTRFMAVKNQKELRKSRVIAIIWVTISLAAAVAIGVIGRVYLFPTILGTDGNASAESVFIEMITKMFTKDTNLPFIGGIFLCGILAAIMSTADSQLLVTASSVSKDIYKDILRPESDEKKVLKVSRFTVLIVALLAFLIAWNPNNSIMGLVSNAWAGLGSAFGPIVVMSLFWRRTNFAGAVAGIVSGGATVLIWDYLPLVHGQTLGTATGLYSLVVGFALSILCIVIFSLCTKEPSQEILAEFDEVKNWKE